MAGTAILKKHNSNCISVPANLNITLHTVPANTSCLCLWPKQTQIAESNNSKCSSNSRPMKEISTNSCHNSCCTLDDRTLTKYNCTVQLLKKKQQLTKQRPLTLRIAVIIMSLVISLIQMPTMVQSKSLYGDLSALDNGETFADLDSKLLLSLLTEAQARGNIPAALRDESSSAMDVLRHTQHTQQHQRERRTRLRKRHTGDLIITKYLHESDDNSEWRNPCNVAHINMEAEPRHITKQLAYQYLKKLERDVGMEYEFISATANAININDMADWSKHDEIFKFLPKLNHNGGIALSRWYRNMQVYVASFGYLARVQYKFDAKKLMFAGRTSEELNKLLASARFILCELETTINSSVPNNNIKKLRTISRKAMNHRLNFVTKHQLANGGILAANTVDLKFVKYLYFQYLLNMEKILSHKLQSKRQKYGYVDSPEDGSNNVIVGDDTSSLDFSSIFKSDSSLSLGESVEILLNTKKPHTQRRRAHKRQNNKSNEA